MATGNSGALDGVRRIAGKFRDLAVDGGLPGAPLGFRLRGATQSGPPVTGTWKAGDTAPDRTGAFWTCVKAGSPGTWAPAGTRWYSVKGYGATGNGTADDTAAIQAAVTACGTAGGGVVYFPAGTYACTGAINVDYSNVTLLGDGWGNATSLTYIPGASRTAAIIIGVTAPVANSNVIGLAVNSGTSRPGAIQAGSGHGIVFRSETGLIRDVTVTYTNGDGLHLSMDALTPADIYDVTMFNNYVSYVNNDCVYVDTNFYNCEFTVVKCQGGCQAGPRSAPTGSISRAPRSSS